MDSISPESGGCWWTGLTIHHRHFTEHFPTPPGADRFARRCRAIIWVRWKPARTSPPPSLSFPISAQADQLQERNGWQKFIIANLTAGLRAAFIVGKWISNRQHRHRANCKPADCGAFHQRPSKSGGKCFSRSLEDRAKNRFPYLPKYCAQSVRVRRRLRGSGGFQVLLSRKYCSGSSKLIPLGSKHFPLQCWVKGKFNLLN